MRSYGRNRPLYPAGNPQVARIGFAAGYKVPRKYDPPQTCVSRSLSRSNPQTHAATGRKPTLGQGSPPLGRAFPAPCEGGATAHSEKSAQPKG
jgi:hypothetical protein